MIELQGITKSFGTLQVLKGIDLMIEKGEVVSIEAPSGGVPAVRGKLHYCRLWERWIRRIRVLFY